MVRLTPARLQGPARRPGAWPFRARGGSHQSHLPWRIDRPPETKSPSLGLPPRPWSLLELFDARYRLSDFRPAFTTTIVVHRRATTSAVMTSPSAHVRLRCRRLSSKSAAKDVRHRVSCVGVNRSGRLGSPGIWTAADLRGCGSRCTGKNFSHSGPEGPAIMPGCRPCASRQKRPGSRCRRALWSLRCGARSVRVGRGPRRMSIWHQSNT